MGNVTMERQGITELLDGMHVHDVDTHISEPRDLWTSRVSSRWGDAVPRLVRDPVSHEESWYSGGDRIAPAVEWLTGPRDEETTLAGEDPRARLRWMDTHGVYSQILYPNLLGFFHRGFMKLDSALGLECVRAYNDFQAEFASADPKRLIPLANLPWWDLDAALAELERCHELGHKGVNFGWEFEKMGYPRLRDAHWTPLLKRVEEMGLSVNFHIGFNTEFDEAGVTAARSSVLDRVKTGVIGFSANLRCIAEIIMGQICERYPTLKFVSVESGVGFLPYLVEALDWQFLNLKVHRQYPQMLLPSEYFRRQIYGTFWFERDVVQLAELYPDNFMFESDFPHNTSLTPGDDSPGINGPRETIIANLPGLPQDLLRKVLQDNAARVYHLEVI